MKLAGWSPTLLGALAAMAWLGGPLPLLPEFFANASSEPTGAQQTPGGQVTPAVRAVQAARHRPGVPPLAPLDTVAG